MDLLRSCGPVDDIYMKKQKKPVWALFFGVIVAQLSVVATIFNFILSCDALVTFMLRIGCSFSSLKIQDRAPSTMSTYVSAYRLCKRWACTHNLCPIPAALALYVLSLTQQQRSVSTVNSALYGIDWVHKKNGFGLPSEYSVVKQDTEAAHRVLAKPSMRKNPLTLAQVTAMVAQLEKGPLMDLQVAAMIALGFYGFLRWDDLSRITPDHLVFTPTHLVVCLKKRKNSQFREGS